MALTRAQKDRLIEAHNAIGNASMTLDQVIAEMDGMEEVADESPLDIVFTYQQWAAHYMDEYMGELTEYE